MSDRVAKASSVGRPRKISLPEKFGRFADLWSPKLVGRLNDYDVKLVKLRGEFVWHSHTETDELFLVLRGRMTIRFRDGDVRLEENELLIVPRGVEHMPVAEEEAWVVLIEPEGTVNTGDVVDARTVRAPEPI